MPNTPVPLRSPEEVASIIGANTRTILAKQDRNLDWIANEIGISVHSILKAFSERVETGLLFELAFYLEVPADRLCGADQ